MVLGSTQPLTEMSARNLPGGNRRVGLTNLPPSVCRMSENMGASKSHNPKGLQGLYRDSFALRNIHAKPLQRLFVFACNAIGSVRARL
jgi:hypothetical protein